MHAATRPSWVVDAPWDVTHPLDRPLTKLDIKAHVAMRPHLTPNNRIRALRLGKSTRCMLAYLIPQSNGLSSRLILGWAFKAPLVCLREIGVALPRATIEAAVGSYDPQCEFVLSEREIDELEATDICVHVTARTQRLPMADEADTWARVVYFDSHLVVVAPVDTPAHAYSPALSDFPGL